MLQGWKKTSCIIFLVEIVIVCLHEVNFVFKMFWCCFLLWKLLLKLSFTLKNHLHNQSKVRVVASIKKTKQNRRQGN